MPTLNQTSYFESIFCSCAKAGGGGYKSNYSNIDKSSKKSATLMSYWNWLIFSFLLSFVITFTSGLCIRRTEVKIESLLYSPSFFISHCQIKYIAAFHWRWGRINWVYLKYQKNPTRMLISDGMLIVSCLYSHPYIYSRPYIYSGL